MRALLAGRASVVALVAAASVQVAAAPASADPAPGRLALSDGADIWTMNEDGTDLVRLAGPGNDTAPTWSPDGTRIAFESNRTGNGDIYVMDADGSDVTRLTDHPNADRQPAWSPDGLSIVFNTHRGIGTSLWIMNSDGTGETPLTGGAQFDEHPAWSPDNASIAFRTSRSGSSLYVMNRDGSNMRPIGAGSWPAWTPDGAHVVYALPLQGGGELFRVTPTGSGNTRLTTTTLDEQRPSVSPDGQSIAYDRNVDGGTRREVVVARADGSEPRVVTPGTGSWTFARYAPAATDDGTAQTPPGTGTGSTTTGQVLDVAITAPTLGASVPATSEPFTVAGTAGLAAISARPYHAAYVVDVSGSTADVQGRDCDGSGAFHSTNDNLNVDSRAGDILDCEIAAVIALNNAVGAVPSAMAGVIALGGGTGTQISSVLADMSPAGGDQPATAAAAITAPSSRGHVETVLRSLVIGNVRQYTNKTLASGTDYDAALERMNAYFLALPRPATNVAYFLSDGEPNEGTFDTTVDGALQTAAFRGTRIFTYAVGTNAGGCGTGQPLRVIADRTGGTCTAVSNPALLAAALSTPATLSDVLVRLDGGAPVTATLDTATTPPTWSARLPGGLPPGSHTLTATARASDGSSVTATGTVTGLAAPVPDAGGPYTVEEGSTVALAGAVTDADGGTPTVSWTPADRLTGADTLTPGFAGIDDGENTVTLTATDSGGLTGSDTATVTTVNVAPALGAATLTPQPVTGAPFTVAVPFTDPGTEDTHTATVDWGDGTVEDATVDGLVATGGHTYASGGQVTITVTVTDDDGGAASTQTGPFRVNTTPVADAGGPYAVDEGDQLELAGVASDADGDPLTVAWSPADRVTDPTSPTSTYDTADDADEVLTLTVGDGDLSASAQAQVTVRNVAPTLADLVVPTGVVAPGQPVELTATYADPGAADTHSASVDWGDGTVEVISVDGGEVRAGHTYAAGGTWPVALTLTDDDDGTATATTSVVTNRPPVVDAGPDRTVDEGSAALLDASATDPDGDPLTLTWTPSDSVLNPLVEDVHLNAVDDGTTTLTLTATDAHGASASDTVEVTVGNVAPSIDTLVGPATSLSTDTVVRLSATYTDPGGADTHTARVDWGDGTSEDVVATAGAVAAEHTYADGGSYTVGLTLTDDDGGTVSRTLEPLVVHDRDGLVAGAGTFDSPVGALRSDPRASSRATFAVGAAYVPFLAAPVGVTSVQLSGNNGFRFLSTRVEWLSVSGSTAVYRGTGTVNGRSGYGFTVTTVDGGRAAGAGDRLQIRVWAVSDGAVVYENSPTALRSGNILVRR